MGTQGEGLVGAHCVLKKGFRGLVDHIMLLWVTGKLKTMDLAAGEERRLKRVQ